MKARILSTILILSMLIPTLVSCNTDTPETPDDSGTTAAVSDTVDTDAPEEEFIPHYTYTPTVAQNPDLYIVEDGTSDYVIVRGENASPSEVTAANELQLYIEKISGATLPIVLDTEAPAAHEIVVGKTNRETDGQFDREELGDEGFVIDITEDTVWLVGGELRGTLYSVYTFLEEHLGCRFYSSQSEFFPTTDTIGLAVGQDQQIPINKIRSTSWRCCTVDPQVSAQMKFNSNWAHTDEYGGSNTWVSGLGCHTISRLLGASEPTSSDPCLSSEATYEGVLQSLRYYLSISEGYAISISQNDIGPDGVCPCDVCAASIEEHGYSGHYLKFVNRIAEELADEYPDVLFHTFAYHFTTMPPKSDVVPADNVLVQLCTIGACHAHTLNEHPYQHGNEDLVPAGYTFKQLIEEWSAISNNLMIWEYSTNFGAYNAINPNLHDLWENMQTFVNNDVRYFYYEGASDKSYNGGFGELRAYLIGKLLWDPYMTREEFENYMNGFLHDYYGPGWEYIRAFIDLADAQSKCQKTFDNPDNTFPADYDFAKRIIEEQVDLSDLTAEQIKNPASVDWLKYYEQIDEKDRYFNETLARGYEYFAKAAELAQTDAQRNHIEQSSIQLDVNYSTLVYNVYQPEVYFLKLIYKTALDQKIASGEVSEIDGYTLTYRFDDEVLDSYYKEKKQYLTEFNKALHQKMLKYDITYIYASNKDLSDPNLSLDFSNPPCGGYGTTYTGWGD